MVNWYFSRKAPTWTGVIVFGDGLNARYWINLRKTQGFNVLICDGYALYGMR